MSVEFSKRAIECSSLSDINCKTFERWFQLGGEKGFPFPLRVQSPYYSILSGPEGSSSIYQASDRSENRYWMKFEKALDGNFSVRIFDNRNHKSGLCCGEQKSGSSITIQSLTDEESQRVHDAARSAFVLTETVWHV